MPSIEPATGAVSPEPVEHPLNAELARLEASIAMRWTAVGLSQPPSTAGLEPLRRRIDAARQADEARRAIQRDRERAVSDLRAASTERAAAEAALTSAQQEVEAGVGRWAAFLVAAGLPATLDRDAAADLVSRLEGARANLDEAISLGQTIGKTERERLLWAEGVRRLASDLGVPNGDDASVVVERLRQDLAAARTSSRARDGLVQRRDEAGRIERGAAETLATERASHAAFLAQHGVPDGERLAARHARGAERASVSAHLAQAETTFRQLVRESSPRSC